MGSLLTPEEVATVLRLQKQTVYRLIRDGELPAIQVGRRYRVDEQDLQAFIAAARTRKEVGIQNTEEN